MKGSHTTARRTGGLDWHCAHSDAQLEWPAASNDQRWCVHAGVAMRSSRCPLHLRGALLHYLERSAMTHACLHNNLRLLGHSDRLSVVVC